MTIKVVKQGKKPVEAVYESECKSCGSVLEAVLADLEQIGGYLTLKPAWFQGCPVCNCMTRFYPKEYQ